MTSHSIAAIVSYISNDYRFLRPCIEGLKPFCDQIIVPVSTHSVSGVPENLEMLHRSYAEHPDCQFIEFAYDSEKPYGIKQAAPLNTPEGLRYWHSTSRYVGWHFVKPSITHLLFVDVDEICEGNRFLRWMNSGLHDDAVLFASYQYFREPRFRATTFTNMSLLIRKDALPPELIFNTHERPGIFYEFEGKKRLGVRGLDNRPLFHHYSWVRPKDEILFKVRNWGHKYDKDWEAVVEEEFSRKFNGKEQFCNYRYRTVQPSHPILETDVQRLKKLSQFRHRPKNSFPHLTCVTAQEISRLNIQKIFF